MLPSRVLKFGFVLTALALTAGLAMASPPPPGNTNLRPGGPPRVAPGGGYRPAYPAPYYNSGPRVVIGIGIGSGYGGYYGQPYSSPYSSFSTFGVPYNQSYSTYGYGLRGSSYNLLGTPAIPGVSYPAPQYQVVPAQPVEDPTPAPLPLPPNGAATGANAPATITVIASEGTKVSFDGIDTEQTGVRHSFTTKPIAPGVETRVSIKVDGPGGPSTLSLRVRAGEKATVDMRR